MSASFARAEAGPEEGWPCPQDNTRPHQQRKRHQMGQTVLESVGKRRDGTRHMIAFGISRALAKGFRF